MSGALATTVKQSTNKRSTHQILPAELDAFKVKGTISKEMFSQELKKLLSTRRFNGVGKAPKVFTPAQIRLFYPEARANAASIYKKVAAIQQTRKATQKRVEKATGLTWAQVAGGVVKQKDPVEEKDAIIADLRFKLQTRDAPVERNAGIQALTAQVNGLTKLVSDLTKVVEHLIEEKAKTFTPMTRAVKADKVTTALASAKASSDTSLVAAAEAITKRMVGVDTDRKREKRRRQRANKKNKVHFA